MAEIEARWNQLLETLGTLEESNQIGDDEHLSVVQQLGALRLVQPFNWNAWGAEVISVADLDQLDIYDCVRHITRIVRADRFSEGILAGMISSGYLRVLCSVARRRAAGKPVPKLPKVA